jgi:hypothetical protein
MEGKITPERQIEIDEAMAILRCMTGREISAYFASQKRAEERGEPLPPLPAIYRKRLEEQRATQIWIAEMAQKKVAQATSQQPDLTPAQRAWFNEFAASTGGDGAGLDDLEAGLKNFAEAAQHSLACYRQEAQETANRLERDLSSLIV